MRTDTRFVATGRAAMAVAVVALAWLPACGGGIGRAQPAGDGGVWPHDGPGDGTGAPGDGAETPCEPGATEPCYSGPPGTANQGACRPGVKTCVVSDIEFPTWGACAGEVLPAPEVCNGLDDDCDGTADNGLSCVPPGAPCQAGDVCEVDTRCIEFPSGKQVCDNPTPCSGPTSKGECAPGVGCVEFPDHAWYCYDEPGATCWAHYWFDYVSGGVGSHLDTCMNCSNRPGLENGSQCVPVASGADLLLECHATLGFSGPVTRTWQNTTVDFLALDQPMNNPAEFTRCLSAWGVHRLVEIDTEVTAYSIAAIVATARVPGAAAQTAPLTMSGLSTSLPAGAFQHAFVEVPPLPTVPLPTTKQERAARVFWEEPSVVTRRFATLHAPYNNCPTCVTFDDLIDWMYPGPEVFCQGLARDPADSQFVVPFWMPHYDAATGTQNHLIVSELVCELPNGTVVRSPTAMPLPYVTPTVYPTTYP